MRTIRSAAEIDGLFREGTRVSHPLLLVLAKRSGVASGRVVFVAGRKLGNAVARNRAKRVLREALRRAGGPWPATDMALIARPGTGAAAPRELDEALEKARRATADPERRS